ncbi:MAG: amidohydrolase family protein [Phycisphaerales bacterium]|jgi:hypothetical protein|nr:amidohydrolase family protein [Phycisphaerales bacterium]
MSRTIHLCGGKILSNPKKGHFSSSITIVDGYVAALGELPPTDSQIIELGDKFAIPGFVDSHLHLVEGATLWGGLDLSDVKSKDEFLSLINMASLEAGEGEWIVGSGWSEKQLGGIPNLSWFENSRDIPAIFFRKDFHAAVINKSLLQKLDTENVMKLSGGQELLSGIVKEDALFEGVSPLVPSIVTLEKIHRVKKIIKKLHANGITSVGSMENYVDVESVLVPITNERLIRIGVMLLDQPSELTIARSKLLNSQFMRTFGFKAFLDGSLGSRTAKMYQNWNDVDSDGLWAGVAAKGELDNWVKAVTSSDFSPAIHAIGDLAVGVAVEALKYVDNSLLSRIEHAQFIADKDISKISGNLFGVQPLHQPDDLLIAKEAVEEDRIKQLHNWRRMIDHGAILSFGSDWPVVEFDPIASMSVAIGQGLTPMESLIASTANAALSIHFPKSGMLEIGSHGDLVILDKDPLNCDWKECSPSVTMTILDGNIVYEKEKTDD